MFEKLKSLIQSDIEKIEIERCRVKNEELKKELLLSEERLAKDDYKGINKLKILYINNFKYEDNDSYYIFFKVVIFMFLSLVCIALSFISLLFLLIVIQLTYFLFIEFKNVKCETIGYKNIRDIRKKIEENNNTTTKTTTLFKTSNLQYKNYTDLIITKDILRESLNVLNEENFKEVLRLSGGDNIKYGYLIKEIINQEEKEKLNEVYSKIKNNH